MFEDPNSDTHSPSDNHHNPNSERLDSTLSTNTPEVDDDGSSAPTFHYQGPVDDQSFEQELGKTTKIQVSTFDPIYRIRRVKSLDDRRIDALEAGANGLDKLPLFHAKVLSKRLTYDVFLEETRLLDKVLTEVRYAFTSEDSVIFTVDPKPFCKLLKRLVALRKKAQDSILVAGMAIPETPIWGRDGDIGKFHNKGDFEILGICFRAEVENFLWRLQERFDFSSSISHSAPTEEIDYDSQQPKTNTSTAGSPRAGANRHHQGAPDEGTPTVRERPPVSSIPGGYSQVRQKQAASMYGGKDRKEKRPTYPPAPEIPKHTPVLNAIFEQLGDSFFKVAGGEQAGELNASPSRVGERDREQPPHLDQHRRDRGIDRENDYQSDASKYSSASRQPRDHQGRRNRDHPGDPDGSDDDGDNDNNGDRRRPVRLPRGSPGDRNALRNRLEGSAPKTRSAASEPHFDLKLKFDNVPKWDGNTDTIARWFLKVNALAKLSSTVFEQLGTVVPKRLEGSAETWYWSLPIAYRSRIEENWDTLRTAIGTYYMNRKWLDRQKGKANRAYYRETGCLRESPSEYFIRKSELLNTVYSLSDAELIMEVMDGAPASWNTVLTTQLYDTVLDFQSALRFHEDTLVRLDNYRRPEYLYRDYLRDNNPFRNARTNLVGWSSKLEPPKFPKDDSNVSKKITPEQKGARPCRHCGSGKHWDPECKHAYQSNRAARSNHVQTIDEEIVGAQECYDELYYGLDSGDDVCDESPSPDFCKPLQSTEESVEPVHSSGTYLTISTELEGEISDDGPSSDAYMPQVNSKSHPLVKSDNASLTSLSYISTKPSLSQFHNGLNRRSRRRLARDVQRTAYAIHRHESDSDEPPTVELRKSMARPPGCSFLGSKAIKADAAIGEINGQLTEVIVDSGSDITLISETAWSALRCKPKIRTGQRINLVQVTGTSVISGFVTLDLFFRTPEGSVKLNVEAYVVRGMTTPFILGNDFADQYRISIIRHDSDTTLVFGDSNRSVKVQNSTGSSLVDDEGHAFRIRVSPGLPDRTMKAKLHRRNQKVKRKTMRLRNDRIVRASRSVTIPAGTSATVPVNANFSKSCNSLFVERNITLNRSMDGLVGFPDSLVSSGEPFLRIDNFTSRSAQISTGQPLGYSHNPNNWLDRRRVSDESNYRKIEAHASLLRSLFDSRAMSERSNSLLVARSASSDEVLAESVTVQSQSDVQSKAQRNATDPDDPAASEPVEGGPKTAELPEEPVSASEVSKVLDLSPDLTADQRHSVERVILRNLSAFGLNGRLGNYPEHVDIPVKPGTEPVSLPPFPTSPANREVIDQQMDQWIKLGVIEPSKSPWGAPAFIVYRNGKPRMVVDLRRLNERVINDEYPLPKQEDILQTLTGAQWLTTLDALLGFTQLTMTPSASEKLAFRTHRGLWQFKRMPFGYRNGPGVFQRIMQGILAPYLWIFALVYIDDIVVFSRTFDDHLRHLDTVFAAIARSGITLSPSKCHFAYQSLLLLGQKVSRLGLSTHREKVDAIVQLDQPRNISELQTFLGMMVYFSAYIPFYSWIAHPFFQLLKKGVKWEWTDLHSEAFHLCKQVLSNAPVRGYAMPGLPYWVYTDACDYGLAGIRQQVQPISVKDLRGT